MSLSSEIRDIKRVQEIVKVLFKVGMGHVIQKLHLKEHLSLGQRLRKEKFREKEIRPHMLRKAMEELGGAFVKFGQVLSLRPDLVPLEYVKEFEKLQDSVKPFDFDLVQKIVENSLKKKLNQVFQHFDPQPIAAGSIAQVHKATLKTKDIVAVKVMRPDIQQTMQKDIEIMFFFARIMEKRGYVLKNYSPVKLVEEFSKWTQRELDFRIESKNARIFRHNFAQSKTVYFPQVYDSLSSEKILVLEFLDGWQLHDVKTVKKQHVNIDKVLTNGFETILTQVFEHGFFHADPHPGNLFILRDGRISFVDFGIVGYFDKKLKNFSLNFFEGIIDNDVEQITNTLVDMGLGEVDSLFKVELEELIEPLQDATIQSVKISRVLEDVMNLAYKYNVSFPVDFVLFGKTILTLEGVALKYSPKFRLVRHARPYVRTLMRKRLEPGDILKRWIKSTSRLKTFFAQIPEKTNQLLRGMQRADSDIRDIDRDIRDLTVEVDRSSNRVAISLLIAAFIIASVLTLQYDQYTIFSFPAYSFVGFIAAALLAVFFIISFLREKKY